MVSDHLPTDTRFTLVDVGAGAGLLGSYLSRERPLATYRFVEPIDSLRRELGRRHGEDADLTAAGGYPDAAFVTLLDVLEHQEDDRHFMGELAARLAPGATLLVTVPALPALWSGWDQALGHRRRYVKRTFREAVAALPLEILELSYLFPEMVPPGLVRKVTRSAGRGRTEDAYFPTPPRAVNRMLYGVGVVSLRGRRLWPLGSSLFAALRRT